MMFDRDSVPSTVEDAAIRLAKELTEKGIDLDQTANYTAGQDVRNTWSLWDSDSPLKRDAVTLYGIAHADDISGLILAWGKAIAVGATFNPVAHAKLYHEFWGARGTDALTAGGWGW